MKESLYRAKRVDTNLWEFGNLVTIDNKITGIKEYYIANCILIEFSKKKGKHKLQTYFARVKPETIGQFTGCRDMYNKRIFEGDIILGFMIGQPIKKEDITAYLVAWNDDWYSYSLIYPSSDGERYNYMPLNNTCVYRVKGNIHDNPILFGNGDYKNNDFRRTEK